MGRSPSLRVGVLGDFDPASRSHNSTNAALDHAAATLGATLDVSWVPTRALEDEGTSILRQFDGLWASAGGPGESMDGTLAGIRFAREAGWPFFAT